MSGADVLVVEDDGVIRRLITATLARSGTTSVVARDGVEAVDALQGRKFAVLLLDLMMPRMSGWDVIRWLEDHPANRPRTVIVISACAPDVMQNLPPAVVNAVLFKPFDVHQMATYVKGCCTPGIETDRRVKRLVGAS